MVVYGVDGGLCLRRYKGSQPSQPSGDAAATGPTTTAAGDPAARSPAY